MPTILVTTPTGHIGSRVVNQLLAAGATVRVFVRDPARLADDVRDRVDARTGTLEDVATLTDALRGADAAFFLVPPNMTADDWPAFYREIGHNMAEAARAAGVHRAVFLSSLGAHRPDLGPVTAAGKVEEILKPVIRDLAILRPGYFFENAFGTIGTIAQTGSTFGAQPGDLAFPQVATRDIGDVAARWLLDASWSGQPIVGIHGPRDLSLAEQARLIGEAIGREVRYVEVPADAIAEAMRGMGMSPSVVASYREMITGYAASRYERPEARTPETTTPTEFADWARTTLRPAFEAAAAQVPAHA
ncbi:MAG TPA: NAD(P)H-binding protein [Gemmatirosa sp.]